MNANAQQQAAAHGDGEEGPHLLPYALFIKVWAALIALTLVTVLVSYADMKHLTIFTALFIACAKSTLVVLHFMHVAYEKHIFWWFLIAAVGTYVIFILLTFSDYAYR